MWANPIGTLVTDDESTLTTATQDAENLLASLNLESDGSHLRPVSGHNSSLMLPCKGHDGRDFVLKYFVPPIEGKFYPAGVKIEDYARREAAFYRFLDSTDPDRLVLPAPKTVVIDHADPPQWMLLEWIQPAAGPIEESLGSEHVFELLAQLRRIPLDLLLGRRDFPLNRWDVVSYLERVRLMYEDVIGVIGDARWRGSMDFFAEATRWIESRPPAIVHGDFTEQNIMIDADGSPFLVDFERIGIGNEDHDFAWLWIHSDRESTFKRNLLERYLGHLVGSGRIRAEWGIRSALVYLALRRLRFDALMGPSPEDHTAANLGLLDAALRGGGDLFPV